MGDSEKLRFYEVDLESKMRLLKNYSHTSKRPGYEARKTRRETIEGNADPIIYQATDQDPATYRRCGTSRLKGKSTPAIQTAEKGATAKKIIVERLLLTVSVVVGWGRRKAN